MSKFSTGNVVKLKSGSLIIITDDDREDSQGNKCVWWVSFDSQNCSGLTRIESFMRSTTCFCNEHNEGEYDEDCEDCKGTGSYPVRHDGMEGAIILGSNVKEYIIKSLTKNFNF